MEFKKLERNFYTRDTITVAKELLGKYLVHVVNGIELKVKITETEAYCGIDDKGCHSYGGRITERTKVMYSEGGTSYVYIIYGMYDCFNVVSGKEGDPSAVLVRSGQAIDNFDYLSNNRFGKKYDELTNYQKKNFLNGPGKLCKALRIDRNCNNINLCESENLYILDNSEENSSNIYTGKRINIDYAGEYADKPWRFYTR